MYYNDINFTMRPTFYNHILPAHSFLLLVERILCHLYILFFSLNRFFYFLILFLDIYTINIKHEFCAQWHGLVICVYDLFVRARAVFTFSHGVRVDPAKIPDIISDSRPRPLDLVYTTFILFILKLNFIQLN